MVQTLAAVIFLGIFLICPRAHAGPSLLYYVSAQEGQAAPPEGVTVEQLVPTSTGNSSISLGGIASVEFNDGSHVVNGTNNYAAGGGYAAPILPNGNPYPDNYYSTETGSIAFNFSSEQSYIGLLWGSVDTETNGNLLKFYENGLLVGQITGAELVNLANNVQNFSVGSQNFGGTFYLNVYGIDGGGFNEVIASSGVPSFEFAQVTVDPVPEPPFIFYFMLLIFIVSKFILARS